MHGKYWLENYKMWQVLISKPENHKQQLKQTHYMLSELVQNSMPGCNDKLWNCIENANYSRILKH
jgi:DNA/RNA-binding domain of Phe-tRNA-synthetase-like protein